MSDVGDRGLGVAARELDARAHERRVELHACRPVRSRGAGEFGSQRPAPRSSGRASRAPSAARRGTRRSRPRRRLVRPGGGPGESRRERRLGDPPCVPSIPPEVVVPAHGLGRADLPRLRRRSDGGRRDPPDRPVSVRAIPIVVRTATRSSPVTELPRRSRGPRRQERSRPAARPQRSGSETASPARRPSRTDGSSSPAIVCSSCSNAASRSPCRQCTSPRIAPHSAARSKRRPCAEELALRTLRAAGRRAGRRGRAPSPEGTAAPACSGCPGRTSARAPPCRDPAPSGAFKASARSPAARKARCASSPELVGGLPRPARELERRQVVVRDRLRVILRTSERLDPRRCEPVLLRALGSRDRVVCDVTYDGVMERILELGRD